MPNASRHGPPECSIAEWQQRFECGEWTAATLCEAFRKRIAAIDVTSPTLRAIIEPNPDVLDRSPPGSSSGSATAVAANLCVAALGAEVDGSIVRPASANGIVGLKPTVGLVSRSGVIGVAAPQDTAGPMARLRLGAGHPSAAASKICLHPRGMRSDSLHI